MLRSSRNFSEESVCLSVAFITKRFLQNYHFLLFITWCLGCIDLIRGDLLLWVCNECGQRNNECIKLIDFIVRDWLLNYITDYYLNILTIWWLMSEVYWLNWQLIDWWLRLSDRWLMLTDGWWLMADGRWQIVYWLLRGAVLLFDDWLLIVYWSLLMALGKCLIKDKLNVFSVYGPWYLPSLVVSSSLVASFQHSLPSCLHTSEISLHNSMNRGAASVLMRMSARMKRDLK